MPVNHPLALLFDLGGVVIEIDFDRAFRIWQRRSQLSIEEIRQAFKFDLQYQRHEHGAIVAEQYYDHVATMLKIERDHVRLPRDIQNALLSVGLAF